MRQRPRSPHPNLHWRQARALARTCAPSLCVLAFASAAHAQGRVSSARPERLRAGTGMASKWASSSRSGLGVLGSFAAGKALDALFESEPLN